MDWVCDQGRLNTMKDVDGRWLSNSALDVVCAQGGRKDDHQVGDGENAVGELEREKLDQRREEKEDVVGTILKTLGPTGPGLFAIHGVPRVEQLRNMLLPLARDLALMEDEKRRSVLKDNYMNPDAPLKGHDRSVSAFATQLQIYLNGHNIEKSHGISSSCCHTSKVIQKPEQDILKLLCSSCQVSLKQEPVDVLKVCNSDAGSLRDMDLKQLGGIIHGGSWVADCTAL